MIELALTTACDLVDRPASWILFFAYLKSTAENRGTRSAIRIAMKHGLVPQERTD
jgi:hypothetical protein